MVATTDGVPTGLQSAVALSTLPPPRVINREGGVIDIGADLVGSLLAGRKRWRGVCPRCRSPDSAYRSGKLLGLLILPDSARPLVPAMLKVLGVPSEAQVVVLRHGTLFGAIWSSGICGGGQGTLYRGHTRPLDRELLPGLTDAG